MELINKNAGKKICYACSNGLTGTTKEYFDQDFEHDYVNDTWDCHCKEIYTFYCPQCNDNFEGSKYLESKISDDHVLWLANMITHHRHNHIKSYEKSYENTSYNKYYNSFHHDEFRTTFNERAKRVILRKHRL